MRRARKLTSMVFFLVVLALVGLPALAPAGAAPVSVGRSGWLWGDPVPQGETLNRVAFQGARGYAAGEGGTVLRSDDGGNTWLGLASGSESNLTLLQEVDANTLVVGGGCTVRESTDAGASFHRLPVNESEQGCTTKVASLSFLNASTGFVEQADGSILLTKDGGQTLEPKTAVPLNGAGAGPIVFTSPTTGFALFSNGSGGHIYRTTDGAGSWVQVGSAPMPLSDLTFVTPTIAYAVGTAGEVLRSEDGGGTWAPEPLALPAGTARPTLTQISCSDTEHCMIATAAAPAGGTNALVRTVDGAKTGVLVSPSGQNLLSVAFSTASTAVAVGVAGATVISSDGGASFPTAISHRLGATLEGPIRIGASAEDAYIPGHAGVIADTLDGGADWGVLRVPTSANILDVGFPTTSVGYAFSATGTVYRTATGGLTWSILNSGGGVPSALLAPNEGTVLLVGPTGLRRSSNGGASFAPVAGSVVLSRKHKKVLRRRLSAFPLFSGAEIAGSALIAWGDEAIESTNGGATWKLIPRPLANGSIESVSFVSPSTGYVTSRQRLFFTRNTGKTWKEIDSLGTEAFGGQGKLSFSSAADGYVLARFDGAENVVLRTFDGGRTWSPETLPQKLNSVTAAGTVDYAAAAGGLFETTGGGISATPSKLTLQLSGPHTLSRAKLKKAHSRVKLKGLLSPAQGGEQVLVAYRVAGRAVWHRRVLSAASDGAFSLTIPGISATTQFVAQWAGEGSLAGAGTAAVALTVTKH
jgi:photosystem II stability/assembly factor-like uncharacterized protein